MILVTPTGTGPGRCLVVCAIPCQYIRPVFESIGGGLVGTPIMVSVAKGLEVGSLLRPTEILRDVLGERGRRGVCLSGPTIATELAARMIATMVAAGDDPDATGASRRSTPVDAGLHPRDLLGVEFAGAVKNVMRSRPGSSAASTRASTPRRLLARAEWCDWSRLGARRRPSSGSRGGDLATTCFSPGGHRSCGGDPVGNEPRTTPGRCAWWRGRDRRSSNWPGAGRRVRPRCRLLGALRGLPARSAIEGLLS